MTGDIVLRIDTWDGAAVPAGGQACIREVCQSLGEVLSAAALPGRSMAFAALPQGVHPVHVTGVAPYADAYGEVTVMAGRKTEFLVVLVSPPMPTVPGLATETPVAPDTNGPDQQGELTVVTPAAASGHAGASVGSGSDGTGGVAVRALPNTGIGQSSSNTNLNLLLASGILASIAVGLLGIRRKRSTH